MRDREVLDADTSGDLVMQHAEDDRAKDCEQQDVEQVGHQVIATSLCSDGSL